MFIICLFIKVSHELYEHFMKYGMYSNEHHQIVPTQLNFGAYTITFIFFVCIHIYFYTVEILLNVNYSKITAFYIKILLLSSAECH